MSVPLVPNLPIYTTVEEVLYRVLIHLQHCSCFRDVVIGQILGIHCIEVSSYDCCHQMSDFKAEMHRIRFRPLGELTALTKSPRWI